MQIFLHVMGWLGVAIMGLSLPLTFSEIRNISQLGMGLFLGSSFFLIGTVLLLISGFFSRWRYWSIVALIMGITFITIAIPGLLHDEAIEAARSIENNRVYSINYVLWITALTPGLACIAWGFIKLLSDFIYKTRNFWLGYILVSIVLISSFIFLAIWSDKVDLINNILIIVGYLIPALVLLIEGIILKVRERKQKLLA